jgi:regulatory protein
VTCDPDNDLSPGTQARILALRYLSYRARTESQVRARLGREGFEGELIDGVVAWLKELRYLDDSAYATSRAKSLLTHGRVGPRLAERRLAAAGIPGTEARAAVAGVLDEHGEDALARALLERRTRGAALQDERERARQYRYLISRGFSPSAAGRAVGAFPG